MSKLHSSVDINEIVGHDVKEGKIYFVLKLKEEPLKEVLVCESAIHGSAKSGKIFKSYYEKYSSASFDSFKDKVTSFQMEEVDDSNDGNDSSDEITQEDIDSFNLNVPDESININKKNSLLIFAI